jgi:hypothetical protein
MLTIVHSTNYLSASTAKLQDKRLTHEAENDCEYSIHPLEVPACGVPIGVVLR